MASTDRAQEAEAAVSAVGSNDESWLGDTLASTEERPEPELGQRNRTLGLLLAGLTVLMLATAIGVVFLVLYVEASHELLTS